MITILLLIFGLLILGLVGIIIGGLIYIAWPIALILVLGILLDFHFIKKIFFKWGSGGFVVYTSPLIFDKEVTDVSLQTGGV